jgi:Methyltransferase domain
VQQLVGFFPVQIKQSSSWWRGFVRKKRLRPKQRRAEGEPMESLVAIAQRLFPDRQEVSKANEYYVHYEPFLAPFRGKQPIVFEIGVFQGHSTKVFANYFRDSKLIGIDNQDNTIDFTDYPNVIMCHGDQSDGQFLAQVADQYAPEGIDIIIDDASHIGYLSLKTFEYLFPRMRSGGVYIVEDWGTGYWNDWPDGGAYQNNTAYPYHGQFPKRTISHDFGMVGFVKHLVDQVGMADIRPTRQSSERSPELIESMHIFPETVVIRRRTDMRA